MAFSNTIYDRLTGAERIFGKTDTQFRWAVKSILYKYIADIKYKYSTKYIHVNNETTFWTNLFLFWGCTDSWCKNITSQLASLLPSLVISRYLQILEFSSWQFSDIYCHITLGLNLPAFFLYTDITTKIILLPSFSLHSGSVIICLK